MYLPIDATCLSKLSNSFKTSLSCSKEHLVSSNDLSYFLAINLVSICKCINMYNNVPKIGIRATGIIHDILYIGFVLLFIIYKRTIALKTVDAPTIYVTYSIKNTYIEKSTAN